MLSNEFARECEPLAFVRSWDWVRSAARDPRNQSGWALLQPLGLREAIEADLFQLSGIWMKRGCRKCPLMGLENERGISNDLGFLNEKEQLEDISAYTFSGFPATQRFPRRTGGKDADVTGV